MAVGFDAKTPGEMDTAFGIPPDCFTCQVRRSSIAIIRSRQLVIVRLLTPLTDNYTPQALMQAVLRQLNPRARLEES